MPARLTTLARLLILASIPLVSAGCGGTAPVPGPVPTPTTAAQPTAPPSPEPPATTPAPVASAPFRIVGRYPLAGEPLTDRFVIYFSDPIPGLADPSGGNAPPVSTNPALPLTFSTGPNYIVASFEPAALQRPANYEVSFHPSLRSMAGAVLENPAEPIRFAVPAPSGAIATGLDLISRTDSELRLRLKFSVAMNIDALRQNLRVTDAAGTALEFVLAQGTDATDAELLLPGAPKLPVSISVFAGTPDASGTSPMRSAAAFSFPDAASGAMTVALLRGDDTEGKRGFVLRFSMAVDGAAIGAALTVNDAAGNPVAAELDTVDGSTPEIRLAVPVEAALPLTFRLPSGTLSAGKTAVLGKDFVEQFPAKDHLKVAGVNWVTDEGNLGTVEVQFSKVVNVDVLRKALEIRPADGGDALKYELESGGASNHRIRLLDVPMELKAISLRIAAGLEGGVLSTLPEDFTQNVRRTARPLSIEYADWESRGKDGPALRLDVNQPLDLVSMKAAVSFEPPVDNIAVSTTWTRGLLITGDFNSKAAYTLRVSQEAKSLLGDSVLEAEYTYPLPDSPEVSGAGFDFEDKFYYPRRTAGMVPLQTRNLDEVKVSLSQLFPSNIHVALAYMEDGKTWDDFEGRWARTVAEKSVKVPNTPDKRVTTPLDLKEIMPPDTRGVFGLQLSPGSSRYGTKIVVWTDIGVLSHWINDELVIFAHDLFTLAPLFNAKVTVWSAKNQMMATTTTDDQGVAQVRGLEKSLGVPSLVVIETNDDYTFLRLAPRSEDAVPVTEDMPSYDRLGYDAFLYSDRGLYRPGEVIHARWIGRTNYGDALKAVPLQFELTNPRGSKMQSQAVTLSELGTGGLDIQTDRAWMTGKYTLALKVPGKAVPVGSMQVNIEDFVPNRIKTEVTVPAEQWMVRAPQAVNVRAENLFGGPASNRTASGSVILRKGNFTHPDYTGYSFTNDADFMPEVLPMGEAQTDENGEASFSFTWQGSPKVTFPVQAVVRGEVSELGGRAVSDTKEVLLLASDKLLGVNVARGGSGNEVTVNVAAATPDGSPAAVPSVKVVLEREDWSYYVRRYSSYNEPRFTKTYAPVEAREVQLSNGRASVSLGLPEYSWGYFRVRITSSTTPMAATQAFYKTWDGIELADTPRPSLIKLVLSKEKYTVGDEARLRIESPFDGRAVIVLQGDAFHRVLTAEVKDGAGEAVFPLDALSAPNLWAETTVVHVAPKDRAQVYPYSSFAMINVPVQDPARRIDVSLPDLPEEVRPAQTIQIPIETRGQDGAPVSAEVTLAAVDEGIHGILGYEDPDPWNFLQRPRRPDYRRAHYYDRVAYDFTPESIGGDLAARLSKRSATIGDNWIKPVALWSGTVMTDAEGKAVVSLDVPEFNGQLRLVAVAAGSAATGAGSKQLYVRRPYILQASLPRFALPGDTFQGRAVIFNTSTEAVKARLTWETSGALASAPGFAEIELAPGKDGTALADFTAANAVGQGNIVWKAEILAADGSAIETLTQDMPLPVRPPAAYQSRSQLAVLKGGESREFTNTMFVDDEQVELTLTVGNDPALRIANALKALVGYPYGCIEQTTSRCMPLYLMRKSSALVENTLAESARLDMMLKQGITRLFSMQVAGGGLGYWPGATSPDRYGSVYALHFLSLVKRDREIELPEANFRALQEYVRLVGNETSDSSLSGLYLRAYAHFVLAIDGDAEALAQIARFDGITMPASGRYLLAAAIAMNSGDAQRAADYLKSTPTEEYTAFERDGTLNSEARNTAVKLLALVQMGADEEKLAPHVEALTRHLESQEYYVTQETAFACTALGAYLNRFAQDPGAAGARIVGPEGTRELRGGEHVVLRHRGPGGKFTVTNTGDSPLYVNFAGAGLPLAPVTEAMSAGIKLTRSVLTADKAAKSDNVYTQGDTYVVQLDIESPEAASNLVLVDMLPAGFEIENPRLDAVQADEAANEPSGGEEGEGFLEGEEGSPAPSDNPSSTPSYLDVRDDRLVLAFNKLPQGSHTVRYLVRAVTPGAYQQPGALAECMYDPKIRANVLPSAVEVK